MVDQWGNTPFMLACKANNLEIIKKSLEDETIDVNARANNGMTAFLMVCRASNEDLIRLLLSNNRINFSIKNNQGKDAIDISNYECRRIIREEMFRRKIRRLRRYALQYARSTILNRDVWLMILFRCLHMTMISSDRFSIRRCQIFAEELKIPHNKVESKIELLLKISETLSISSLWSPQILPHLYMRNLYSKEILNNIIYSAQRLGISRSNKTISNIVIEIENISNVKWK